MPDFKRLLIKTRLVLNTSLLIVIIFSVSSRSITQAESLNNVFYDPPTTTSGVFSLNPGPDGNMWFTKSVEGQIGRVTMDGVVTEYNITSGLNPGVITAGPDGNMWFTWTGQSYPRGVAKMNMDGVVTNYYDLSGELEGSVAIPSSIAAGPDGNMWVGTTIMSSAVGTAKIIKVNTSGVVLGSYALPEDSPGSSYEIIVGVDGNMWTGLGSAANSDNHVAKITMDGVVTLYKLDGTGDGLSSVAKGTDGNMWYLRSPVGDNKIGKVDTSGDSTDYDLPEGAFAMIGIAAGPDGNMWFTESGLNKLANITPDGAITEYDLPANTGPISLALGPDDNMWFGTQSNIGRVTNTPKVVVVDPDLPPTPPKTGKLASIALITITAGTIVLITIYEYRRVHRVAKSSPR